MRNKKADITVTILVIGVFIVCSLALISFYSSDIFVKKSFESVALVQKVSLLEEEIRFYESEEIRRNPEEIMGIFSDKVPENDFVFEGEKTGENSYVVRGEYFVDEDALVGFFGLSDKKRIALVRYGFNTDS